MSDGRKDAGTGMKDCSSPEFRFIKILVDLIAEF
jgi:hypothetical protein